MEKEKMIKKQLAISKIKQAKEPNVITVIASTSQVDRDGEVIKQDGWVLDYFLENPVFLWAHKNDMPPVGRAKNVRFEDGNLVIDVEFTPKDVYEFGHTIGQLYKNGFLNAVSVGFMPRKWRDEEVNGQLVRVFDEQELLEVSGVPVASNRGALMKMKSCGIGKCGQYIKSALPYHRYDVIMDEEWDVAKELKKIKKFVSADGSGDKDKINWEKYALFFAYVDNKKKKEFSGYKLPHHVVRNGEIKTIWSGVKAAMASLMGASGGVDIPETEIKDVYKHLAKEYKNAGKEPPEMKDIEEYRKMAVLYDNYKALIKTYRKYLKDIRDAMELPTLNNEVKSIEQVFGTLLNVIKNKTNHGAVETQQTTQNEEIGVIKIIGNKEELAKLKKLLN